MYDAVVSSFWPKVFDGFRAEDHRLLVVSTTAGLEVAVQELCRIEDELVMIRGRIAGTADGGRLFLLPYSQLASVYVNRVVRLEEIDLFSPSVSPERKMEVSRVVAEIERRARDEARAAEASKSGGIDVDATIKKLETLRDSSSGDTPLLGNSGSNDARKAPGNRFMKIPPRAPEKK